jgi:predicted acylesterase/phospholipase RssA
LFLQKNIYTNLDIKLSQKMDADSDIVINTPIVTDKEKKMNPIIKHLVISGGAATGFAYYGALKELNRCGFWDIKNIESIYATSIGTYISMCIMLNYSWEILDDFLIKRPWHQVFKFDLNMIFQSFAKGGVYDKNFIYESMSPILKGKDIPVDVTLQSFFEITNIDFHLMTTDMDTFENVDLSHTTHPEWKLLDAIAASSCLPVFFEPFKYENKTYLDGGIYMNNPIQKCIQDGKQNSEILGIFYKVHPICNKFQSLDISSHVNDGQPETDTEHRSFFELFSVLRNILSKILAKLGEATLTHEIAINQVFVDKGYANDAASGMLDILYSSEKRKLAVESGMESAQIFIKKRQ